MYFSKYSLVLLLLLALTSCKNRDRYLNDSDNMTEISDIKEVYVAGILQKVREIFDYYYGLDLSNEKATSCKHYSNSSSSKDLKFSY